MRTCRILKITPRMKFDLVFQYIWNAQRQAVIKDKNYDPLQPVVAVPPITKKWNFKRVDEILREVQQIRAEEEGKNQERQSN
ncbi:hypothetical protein EX30DRAFT_374519 [Ascodesmis nigricans]|uniref:Uncharacterized protein n=1 Tax=Ascodesmis nigricans TaxID=341454 RepID=A0A4S2MRJ0_9PEZI|nr:hypothetical protein EX30DRAFT_374519 [Ascodesmis nigricans]